MAKADFRIILDTNLWISYLISDRFIQLDSFLKEDKIKLLFSAELIDEFIEVAQRPKFEPYFSDKEIFRLLQLFDHYGEFINVTSTVEKCKDAKDNFLLALAKDGQADYLLTGDSDLLEIEKFESTQVLTYKTFVEELK